jgi:hypothetical protein
MQTRVWGESKDKSSAAIAISERKTYENNTLRYSDHLSNVAAHRVVVDILQRAQD